MRNNLAKLQLQAEVARLRSASRERGAGAERSSSRGRAPQLAEQRSLAYLEAQAAEQARLSAAKRIAEARRQEKEKQEAAREDTLRRREQKRQELLRRMEEKSRARSASPSLTPSTSATSTGGAVGTPIPVSTPSSSSRSQQRGRAASSSPSSSKPHGPRGRSAPKDDALFSPHEHTFVHSIHEELDAPPLYTQEALMAVGLGCSPRSPQPQPSSAATASSALRATRPPPSPSYEVTLHRVWGLEEELGGVWAYATLSLPPSSPHAPPATSRTAPVPSSSPVFNHTCVLRGDGRLLLCVFNQHLSLSDELLGYVEIDLDKEGIVVGEGWGGVYHLLTPSSSPEAPATGGSAEVSLRRIE